VDAEAVESDTWAKVLYTLNTDVIAHALLNRTNGQGGTVEGLEARIKGFDKDLDDLTRTYRNKRWQQGNAMDDQERDELQGEIDHVAERIRSVRTDRDEVAKRIKQLGQQERGREVVAGLVWPVPEDAPQSGEPGHWTAVMQARAADIGQDDFTAERGQVVQVLAGDLTREDKRAVLRWLGVQVKAYRKSEPRPDGTNWEFTVSGSEDIPDTFREMLRRTVTDSLRTVQLSPDLPAKANEATPSSQPNQVGVSGTTRGVTSRPSR
jgi:hypothetical protein